ncbi:hypothetical protein TB2_012628 [Malus domestica]
MSDPETSHPSYLLLDPIFFARDIFSWRDPNASDLQASWDIDYLTLRFLMLDQEVSNCLAFDCPLGYILKTKF